jgi:hypothetical protein
VTTPDFEEEDLDAFHKASFAKQKKEQAASQVKPQPEKEVVKTPVAPKKVVKKPVEEAKPVLKFVSAAATTDDDLPDYEPLPIDKDESTAGIYQQFLSDEHP